MRNVLLLNATYEPLRIIALKRAVVLILQEKAEIIEGDDGEYVRSAYLNLPMPTVIRLKYFVKIPHNAKVALNRKALITRDRGVCQYCRGRGTTIDHIVPRSRGGRHEWKNVTLACGPCNARKDDKLLSELGWTLLTQPTVPKVRTHIVVGVAVIDPAWAPHLGLA